MNSRQAIRVLDEQWEYLDSQTFQGSFIALPYAVRKARQLYVAKNDQDYVLLLPFPSENKPNPTAYEYAPGLNIEISAKQIENKEQYFLSVSCKVDRLHLFSPFAVDLADAYTNKVDPLICFASVFHRWHKYWSAVSSTLPKQIERGLFSELWILDQIAKEYNLTEFIENWVGPEGHLHDFEFSAFDIEVKSTDREPIALQISSVAQLVPMKHKRLFVIALVLEEDSKGMTIAELAETLISKLSDATSRRNFMMKLSKVGLMDLSQNPTQSRFCAKLVCGFEVSEDTPVFPAALLSSIPSTVSDISYRLHISGIANLTSGEALLLEIRKILQ